MPFNSRTIYLANTQGYNLFKKGLLPLVQVLQSITSINSIHTSTQLEQYFKGLSLIYIITQALSKCQALHLYNGIDYSRSLMIFILLQFFIFKHLFVKQIRQPIAWHHRIDDDYYQRYQVRQPQEERQHMYNNAAPNLKMHNTTNIFQLKLNEWNLVLVKAHNRLFENLNYQYHRRVNT